LISCTRWLQLYSDTGARAGQRHCRRRHLHAA
jgi:hypothetical protein